ncbi:alpha/beta fold hydrolase [Gilvimarinus sp. F26214L]|uniref:alpha/beta fold hydrolase n=1 Tax=Gilvimarinus sp. DZF01 TaxID=3461371 RepID=UPI0040460A16
MQLHFEKSGQGPALVMMHGLFGSLENLGAISRILEKKFTLYRLDLRNHGRSPHADSMSFSEMADDLLQFLDRHGLDSVFLFGHSLGAKVGMEFACQHPQRVRKLVVADIAPVSYPSHHNAILDGLQHVQPAAVSSRREADQELARFVDEAAVRQFILKSLERQDGGGYRWRLNVPTILKDYDSLRLSVCDERPFAGPTLFLRGAKSNYIAERNKEEIARKFPDFEIVTVENASHWLHAEQPEVVAQNIIEFLS